MGERGHGVPQPQLHPALLFSCVDGVRGLPWGRGHCILRGLKLLMFALCAQRSGAAVSAPLELKQGWQRSVWL